MPWPDPADTSPAQRAWLASARENVAVSRAGVAACRGVPWVAAAADAYRAVLDDERGRLDRLLAAIETLLAGLSLPGPWPVTSTQLRAGSFGRGSAGRAVRVGVGGFVSVDPEALADAGDRLATAARWMNDAAGDLSRVTWGTQNPWQSGGCRTDALAGRVGELLAGPLAPARTACRLSDLGRSARAAAQVQRDGETGVHRTLRGVSAGLGRHPVSAVLLAEPMLLLTEARITLGAVWADLLGQDPWTAAVHGAEQAWSDAVADGDVELAMNGLAGAVTSVLPSALPGTVTGASAGLAALLAHGGADVELVPRVDPPHLAPPRGLAGIVDVVGKTYDESQPTGLPGTPAATVTVQRLDHPDGSRSWLVAVPGTQSWGFSAAVTTDMGTNLELVGGGADPMTAGVVDAMAAAGIGPDEPVVLAGHSQGGMVAMSVAAAAAGAYRIGGVLAVGSPSVPARLPSGVPVVRLEHDEDVVPQTDGEPTPAGRDVTRITRSVADDHPVLPVEAHAVAGYRETAALVDAQVAAAPGSAPGVTAVTGLLGGDGTTATTFQYRVTRVGAAGAGAAPLVSGAGPAAR